MVWELDVNGGFGFIDEEIILILILNQKTTILKVCCHGLRLFMPVILKSKTTCKFTLNGLLKVYTEILNARFWA